MCETQCRPKPFYRFLISLLSLVSNLFNGMLGPGTRDRQRDPLFALPQGRIPLDDQSPHEPQFFFLGCIYSPP